VDVLDVYATVGGTVQANGADLTLMAQSTTDSKTVARAKVDGSGDATGVGASVAINVADNDTHAKLADGAVLSGVDALTHGEVKPWDGQQARASPAADRGQAGVAVSIATYDTRAAWAGRHALVSGALAASAQHRGSVATMADGEAAGSSAAVGAAIGFTYANTDVVATTLRDIAAAGGAVSFTTSATGQNTTRAKASASGAEDTGSDAQSQGDSKRGAGNQRAASSGTGASGSGTGKKASAETPSEGSESGDSIAVAAAIAIDIVDSDSRAEIGDGRTITSGGVLTLRSRSNVDGSAVADGTAVDAGSVGVGAAVSVNTVDVDNKARLGNSTVSAADGLVIEALMVDRKVGLQATTIPVVDAASDNIFLGMGHGLATGQQVTYKSTDGDDIQGLTDGTTYYVRDIGHGRVELYTSASAAKDTDSTTGRVNLGPGTGTGDVHKLDMPFPQGEVSFDTTPNQLRVIDVGKASGLLTGDEVVYHQDTGTGIGGLADGQTYYVIMIDDGKAQLAASREDALKGKAIALTSDDPGNDGFLTEATHGIRAAATSGAGSDDVGVAGSAAINRGEVITLAESAGTVTLQDGPDGGSGIGAVSVKAAADTLDTADALPEGKGAVADSVGVGASFALNLVYHDTTAQIASGAIGGTAGGVTVDADADHVILTEARNGAKTSGTGVGAAVAVVISDADTLARVGGGATLTSSGAVSVAAHHDNELKTQVSSEATGSNAAVGASVGVAYVTDSNKAQVQRNVITSAGSNADITVAATMDFSARLDVHASAGGGDSGDSDSADQEATDKVNNTSNTGDNKTLASADGNTDSANSQSSSKSGSQGSSVGVAAAVGVNMLDNVENSAQVLGGADLDADGDGRVEAAAHVVAVAVSDSTAVDLDASASIAAAVSVNAVALANKATVGTGSVVTGDTVTVQAITTGTEKNDFAAGAFSVAGNKGDAGIAGVAAVNVVDVDSTAMTDDGSVVNSRGSVSLAAENDMRTQALAASGGFSNDAAVGAAIAIDLIGQGTGGSNTLATLGNTAAAGTGAAVHADGTVSVSATHHIGMLDELTLPKVVEDAIGPVELAIGSLAVAGGGSGGSAGVGASVGINIFRTHTRAGADRKATVNGHSGANAGAMTVTASDTLDWTSVAGSVGVATSGVGVGAGLDLGIVDKTTEAFVGQDATVDLSGTLTLDADASEDILSVSANAGVGSSVGIAGSASVFVITTTTRAYVEGAASASDAATIQAGGLTLDADGDLDLTTVAGSIGAGSGVGAGAANATLVHVDTVEAYVGDRASVTISGNTPSGITIDAHSTEELISVAAAGGFAATAGVSGTAVINILTETTRAYVGRGATVDATGTSSNPGLSVTAHDATTIVSVAGQLAAGGGAGVGVGADVAALSKTTEPSSNPACIRTWTATSS